jgi:UDP-2-acetamido-3-amino-2,3-dideoxy-glucuronate N-acetyltransferase
MTTFIHPLSDVQTEHIGTNTCIWQFVVILAGAKIGGDVNICSHCFVENNVIIGDRVTVKSGVQLWDGVRIEEDVFIGPNVSFTNDRYPRRGNRNFKLLNIIVEKGASIGAGEKSFVAAGSVVTRDVPAGMAVCGNPARVIGRAKHVDQQL